MTTTPYKFQLDAIAEELERATAKFPTWPTDPMHALAVLGEEFGELTKAVLQTMYEPSKIRAGELRKEALQTAAMAVRFLVSLDSGAYVYAQSLQHHQAGAAPLPHPALADAPSFDEAPPSMQYLVGELFEHHEDGPMVGWYWFDIEPVFDFEHGWVIDGPDTQAIGAGTSPAPAGYGGSATDEGAYESYAACILKRPGVSP